MGWTQHGGLCQCIFVLALTGVAVRQPDIDLESDGRRVQLQITEPQVTCSTLHCSKPSIDKLRYANRSGQGLFVVDGKKAQELAPLLRPGWTYSVRADANCREPEQGVTGAWLGKEAEASVVPWPDRMDPVNHSSIEIFIHPRTELDIRLRGTEAWLCTENDNDDRKKVVCLCKLTGAEQQEHWAILGHFATMLPLSFRGLNVLAHYWSDLQLSMERRCPSPWMSDMTITFLVVLVVCFLLVAAEAMIARHRVAGGISFDAPASHGGEKKEYDTPIIVTSPWKATHRSIALAFGFVALIIAWQRTKMRLAMEAHVHENFVWFTIFFICSLGLAGIWRFHHILCREQLVQALLANKVGVTTLKTKAWYDRIILGAVCIYVLTFATLSYNTTKSWPDFAVWLVAVSSTLVGLIWAIYRAAQSAQTVDRDLTKIQLNTAGMASLQCPPDLTVAAFEQVVRICLEGRDPTNKEELQRQSDGRNFKILRDIWWHRRLVYQLTQSTTGFCVLPSLALAALLLLAACAVQAANFACSGGELNMLEVVTAESELHFEPWRDRLVAEMDTTFKGAVLLASADTHQAQQVTYKVQGAGPYELPHKRFGASAAHFHLMSLEVPRVATVDVQGPRDSQANMTYQVRFAPMRVVPMLVSISDQSGDWRRCAGWGAMPGAVLSVPPGKETFDITVHLTEFVVGVPSRPARDSILESWTDFENIDLNETNCTTTCFNDPDCLTSFPGHNGCYFAKHRHEIQETRCWDRELPRGKLTSRMFGELCMCEYEPVEDASAPGCCILVNTSKEMITFSAVSPFHKGIRGALMRLWLAVAVDQQFFWSDLGQVRLSHNPPRPFRVLAHLGGRKTNGEQMSLRVNGTVNFDGDVTLLVPQYDPLELDPDENLKLSVALLLPDREFEVKWLQHNATYDMNNIPNFSECNDQHLKRRYLVCRGSGKWPAKVLTMEVSRWAGCLDTTFQMTNRLNQTGASWEFRVQHLRCAFERTSPVSWAAQDHGCSLLNANATSDVEATATHDAIAASGDALCVLLNKECSESQEEILCEVLSRGFHQASSNHVEIRNGLKPLIKEKLSPLLVCARESACPDLLRPDQWEYNNAHELVLKPDRKVGKERIRPAIPLSTFVSAIANFTGSHPKMSENKARVIKAFCHTTLTSNFSGVTNFKRTKAAYLKWLIAPLRAGDLEMFKAVRECIEDPKIKSGVGLEKMLEPILGKHGWKDRNRRLNNVITAMWHGANKLTDVGKSLKLLNAAANLTRNVSTGMLQMMVEQRYGHGGIADGLPQFSEVKVFTVNLPYIEAVEDLTKALTKTPKLEKLRISCFFCLDRRLPTKALAWVKMLPSLVPALEHLDICDFDFSNIMALPNPEQLFSGQKSLRRLTLDSIQMPSEAWQHIIIFMGCLAELELKDMLDEAIAKHLAIGLQNRSRDCREPLNIILHTDDEVEVLEAEISNSNSTEAPRARVVFNRAE